MHYLVTTSHAVLLVNSTDGSYREVHSGRGLYFGITNDAERIFIAARGELNSSGTPPANERGCILVFDRELKLIDTWTSPFPLRDMHQILWCREQLWITCSFENLIAITDGKVWRQWFPLGVSESEPFDRNHFNTLTPHYDELVIVATNRGPSEFLHFDAASLTLLRRYAFGVHSHNAWRQGTEWLTCSSGEGRIIGSNGFMLACGKFPRGIAITENEIAVGLSELAERHERDLTSGAINIYTRAWELRDTFALPRFGLVLDILAVGANQLGHSALR